MESIFLMLAVGVFFLPLVALLVAAVALSRTSKLTSVAASAPMAPDNPEIPRLLRRVAALEQWSGHADAALRVLTSTPQPWAPQPQPAPPPELQPDAAPAPELAPEPEPEPAPEPAPEPEQAPEPQQAPEQAAEPPATPEQAPVAARVAQPATTATELPPRAAAQRRKLLHAIHERDAAANAATSGPGESAVADDDKPGWEQWVGVRGAAALGAAMLVLAGLHFFRYSIEHNLITPLMRVVLGTFVGVGCMVWSEGWLRRRHELLANWIAGAGAAVLYLCFWAAVALYSLIGTAVAGGLMVVVTAACGILAMRRNSMAIAGLGLLGGFITPLLLSTGNDRPLALFSYLFLLDAALLYLAMRRRWPWLAMISLFGTACYQSLWLVMRMGSERLLGGMLLVASFSALYAFATRSTSLGHVGAEGADDAEDSPEQAGLWKALHYVAALLPFLSALYFGMNATLLPELWQLASYLAVLVVGAVLISNREARLGIGVSATAAALGTLLAWLVTHPLNDAVTWQLGTTVVAFAAGTSLIYELKKDEGSRGVALAWIGGGMLLSLLGGALAQSDAALLPWLLTWGALSLLAVRHGCVSNNGWMHIAAPLFASAGIILHSVKNVGGMSADSVTQLAVAIGGIVVVGQGVLLFPKKTREHAQHGAALLPLMMLITVPLLATLGHPVMHGMLILLVGLASLASLRHGNAVWLVASAAVAAVMQSSTWLGQLTLGDDARIAYAGHAAVALLLMLWPLLLNRGAREQRWTWRAIALTSGITFLPLLALHYELYGFDVVAPLPLAFAAVNMLALLALRLGRGPRDAGVRHSAIVWLAAAALSFITIAIPLQLENEWITIGWAIQGLALMLLWQRRQHEGLKWFAMSLLAVVTMRLVLNPWVPAYHPRGTLRVFNWLSYTYVVPAVCLLLSAYALARPRLAATKDALAQRSKPFFQQAAIQALVSAGLVVIFVWLNLTIIDWFAPGRTLDINLDRQPARDLSMSIAWAIYSLVLLAIGMWKRSGGLRKLSLGLVLVTCAKVFLYDLSHLRDLHRVMSLMGLALSLIIISLAYQRFVFKKSEQPNLEGGAA